MSEKRFLNFIFIEGILLTVLGLGILIFPKLTEITFGVMLSSAFIVYGLYKIIASVINRNFSSCIIWSFLSGIFILSVGVLLLLVPRVSLLWLIALIGVFFLFESVSSAAFMAQIRTMFNLISCKGFAASILFAIGLIIILGLPVISFWVVSMLCGIALLVKGLAKVTISLANRNKYNI